MSLLFPGAGILKEKEEDVYASFFSKETETVSEEAYHCSGCDSSTFIEVEKDAYICKKCDILLGYAIDMGPEYRWFGSDDRSPDPTRVGGPMNPLLPESSLATRIVWRSGDSKAMRRIRQFHLYSAMPSRERTLWNVFEILNVRAANAGISLAILEEAKQLYAQISPRCILRKPQRDALLAACIFESLKRHGSARHPKEVADMFSVEPALITKALKHFSELLEEHAHEHAAPTMLERKESTTSTTFRDYIEAALLRLELPRVLLAALKSESIAIGVKVDEIGICPETTPPSLAAAAISLACEKAMHPKSIATVSAALEISAATLSKCLKRCVPWKKILLE